MRSFETPRSRSITSALSRRPAFHSDSSDSTNGSLTSSTTERWSEAGLGTGTSLTSGQPPELTAKAAITGTGNVGAALTCTAAFVGATSVSYTWLLDGAPVPGATTAAYTPVAADAGHQATC
jgi:hypothetical protein